MFLKLHYKVSGREFLVNTSVIVGVEINGTADNGSVLTLTTMEWNGERGFEEGKYETVAESFDEMCRLLWNIGLMGN